MVLTTLPASPTTASEPEDNAPASGGRRRIVPFVAKRSEPGRAPAKQAPAAKEKKAAKATRAAVLPSASRNEDAAQTLVPLPRRPIVAEAKPKAVPVKKDAFILSFPTNVRASEVQAAGAAQGLAITLGYVHWVRSRAKAVGNARATGAKVAVRSRAIAAAKPPRASDTQPRRPAAVAAPPAPLAVAGHVTQAIASAAIASLPVASRDRASAEQLIVYAAARSVGLDRAIALLTAARGRVGRLLEP